MAEAVKMYIEKFGGEVLIDENHPLAIAQREKDAKRSARKAPKPDSDEDDSTSPNLARLNLAQLTALAGERGVVVPEGSSKKEIITLLEAFE